MLEYKLTCSVELKMFFMEKKTTHFCYLSFHVAVVGLCHLFWIVHILHRAEDFLYRHWTCWSVTDVGSRATLSDPTELVTVTRKEKKKLFTIFDLFCNVLIYFSRFYLTLFQCYCFFCFVFYLKRSKNCCSSASDFIWVTITSTACSVVVRFWSAVQSLSLFTRWHLALREKLQSMVTALEYL